MHLNFLYSRQNFKLLPKQLSHPSHSPKFDPQIVCNNINFKTSPDVILKPDFNRFTLSLRFPLFFLLRYFSLLYLPPQAVSFLLLFLVFKGVGGGFVTKPVSQWSADDVMKWMSIQGETVQQDCKEVFEREVCYSEEFSCTSRMVNWCDWVVLIIA